MSLFFGIEAIAGLIPIHLYLQKLRDRSQLRAYAASHNHILQLLCYGTLWTSTIFILFYFIFQFYFSFSFAFSFS